MARTHNYSIRLTDAEAEKLGLAGFDNKGRRLRDILLRSVENEKPANYGQRFDEVRKEIAEMRIAIRDIYFYTRQMNIENIAQLWRVDLERAADIEENIRSIGMDWSRQKK